MIQALTDAINLFLLNKGLKSYLNNFTLKMKAPTTQEEINYRESLNNTVSAISSIQGLFTDIEDKPRRLRILKALLTALNYGDEINVEIDAEIEALEEAAAAAATEGDGTETDTAGADTTSAATSTDASSEESSGDTDLGTLGSLESFNTGTGNVLLEDQELNKPVDLTLLTEDDLPSPAELDSEVDFSENH